jgi:glycosyltransferase involved in cell wall biosynthesis
LKILTILTYYHPHWTGLTVIAKTVAEGLAARGHKVTVLTTRHHPSLERDETLNGVRVIRLRPLARVSRGTITPAFPSAARALIAEHDVVHIHTPLMESALVAVLCRRRDTPLVITHQGDLILPAGVVNRVIERTVTGMMTRAGHRAAALTTHNRDYARRSTYLAPFGDKVTSIHPPVVMPEPRTDAVAAWRRELGLTESKVIGFAGRFVEEKGLDHLLEAVPSILAREPRAHLLFAGESMDYEDFYERRCAGPMRTHGEHVTSLGLIRDRQRLADFYAMCDVFALPSRSDAFATVQVEAMLCGTPVVATDIPGARDAVLVTGMGVLVEPRSPSALADGLVRVLAAPERYRQHGARAREVFSAERAIDEYEALLAARCDRPIRAPVPA